MSIVNLRKLAVVLTLGSALAACSGNQNGGQSVDQGASVPTVPETAATPQAAPLAFESISVGSYVQDGTFAVGGVGSQFSTSAPLFASVKWAGDAAGANLVIKLLDSSGFVVVEKPAATLTTTQTSTNFTLRGISDARLAAGAYRLDVYANGELKMGADIKIVD